MTERAGMNEAADNQATTAELMSRLLLNREQVAELLGVPPETIGNLHRVKLLPAVRVGKRLCWKPDTVKMYVDSLEPEK